MENPGRHVQSVIAEAAGIVFLLITAFIWVPLLFLFLRVGFVALVILLGVSSIFFALWFFGSISPMTVFFILLLGAAVITDL